MIKERMLCSITVDQYDSKILIIKPFVLKDFEDDNIYDFRLPDIYSTDGKLLKAQSIKYISAPSLAYCTIEDVRAKLGEVELSDEKILYHIREASRLAEVIIAKAYEKQNVKFSRDDLMEYRNSIEDMRNEH